LIATQFEGSHAAISQTIGIVVVVHSWRFLLLSDLTPSFLVQLLLLLVSPNLDQTPRILPTVMIMSAGCCSHFGGLKSGTPNHHCHIN
jgi:hypothetical protein